MLGIYKIYFVEDVKCYMLSYVWWWSEILCKAFAYSSTYLVFVLALILGAVVLLWIYEKSLVHKEMDHIVSNTPSSIKNTSRESCRTREGICSKSVNSDIK